MGKVNSEDHKKFDNVAKSVKRGITCLAVLVAVLWSKEALGSKKDNSDDDYDKDDSDED